jgi:hypothetical protein
MLSDVNAQICSTVVVVLWWEISCNRHEDTLWWQDDLGDL